MLHTLACGLLLSSALLSAEAGPPAGTLLAYRGTVASRRDEAPPKNFDLTVFVAGPNDAYWLVEEQGAGAWPWMERFGRLTADPTGKPSAAGPALLYELDGSHHPLLLVPPLFLAERELSDGLKWTAAELEYEAKRIDAEGRPAWQIGVLNRFGRKREIVREIETPVVRSLAERVFMGMGQEFELKYKLLTQEKLPEAQARPLGEGLAALVALRGKLLRKPLSDDPQLDPRDLETLRGGLPAVEKLAGGGPLARLTTLARRDVDRQQGRAGDVTALAARFTGQAAPAFKLKTLDGMELSEAAFAGKVTVLHFWSYKDKPLKAPYGQVGYLDFLFGKQKAEGVQVWGVAVDSALDSNEFRSSALRGIRGLRSFMNLSYPILLDAGGLLKAYGDPMTLGAELPLFVVVDGQGKIVHYHVGHYEVDQVAGLKLLDDAVSRAKAK